MVVLRGTNGRQRRKERINRFLGEPDGLVHIQGAVDDLC
jgi:hypothetical protein